MFDEADIISDLDQLRSRYDILRRLGVDGAEPVYAARTRDTDRHFALKVMADRAKRSASSGALHGWQAHNVEPLAHPKLMTMHAVHHLQGGAVAVAVDRRRGRTLSERLREEVPVTIEEAESILRDIGEALAYLHGRGVVHRGVRPETIFLDRDAGVARLAHFGMEVEPPAQATVTGQGAVPRSVAPTASAETAHPYLAPEQLKGGVVVDNRVCPATDLFALGVTAWRLLTGSHPAELIADGADGAWRKRLAGRLGELCPDASEQLLATIDQCLEPNPGRRVANGADFLARLDAPLARAAAPSRPFGARLLPREAPLMDPEAALSPPIRRPGESRDPAVAQQPSPRRIRTWLPQPADAALLAARPVTDLPNLVAAVSAGFNRLRLPALNRTRHLPARRVAPIVEPGEPSLDPAIDFRPSFRRLALPGISALLAASTLVVLQLRTSETTAATNPAAPHPSIAGEIEDAEPKAAGVAEGSDLEADLDILDEAGSSSYRIRLRPPAPSPVAVEPARPRTASRQPSTEAGRDREPSSSIPTNRLSEQGGVTAGLVLLGDPLRR